MEKTAHTNSDRNKLLDILKGIAIILVVLGHSIQYGSGPAYVQKNMFFDNAVFKIIYSFHMPLFMLVSGYLFNFSVCNHPFKKVMLSRFSALIVPIFVWAFFIVAIQVSFGNSNIAVFRIIKTYISTGISNLWFLWAIFYCSMFVLMVRRFFNDNIFMYILCFVSMFFIPDVFFPASYKYMFPFFVLAYFYSKNENRVKLWMSSQKAMRNKVLAAGILFAAMVLFYNRDSYIYTSGYCILNKNITRQLYIDIYRFMVGLSGSVFVILLINSFKNQFTTIFFSSMSKIGTCSLGIYIISGYICSGVLPALTANITSANCFIILFETAAIAAISYYATFVLKKYRMTRVVFLGGR